VKALAVFDLDGTLAASKAAIDSEMAALLANLLAIVKVAVISGGDWPQFQAQLVEQLPRDGAFAELSLLPTNGTKFYRFDRGWHQLYAENLNVDQKRRIVGALDAAVASAGVRAERTWGDEVEDRGSQITYSALGQAAPLAEKLKWDPDFSKRKKIVALLAGSLPDFSVRMGGSTSIDVTLQGIDKAYGIRKLHEILGVPIEQMVYVGDALFPGGNDYPVRSTGADCIRVAGPEETKRVIETIAACERQPAVV
jgi:HAD superfamily hydrolase (TIGR01484 family)